MASPNTSEDAKIVEFAKSKYADVYEKDPSALMADVAEIKSRMASDPAFKSKVMGSDGWSIRGVMKQGADMVKGVIDKVSEPAAMMGRKPLAVDALKEMIPSTPESAAVTGATMATGGWAGAPGLAARVVGLPAVGAGTAYLTDGSPLSGGVEGLVSGILTQVFRKGMTPDEAHQVGTAIEQAAPWVATFREGARWTQQALARLGSPRYLQQHLGRAMDGVEATIRNHDIAGVRVGTLRWDIPGLSRDLPLTPQQLMTQARGGAVNQGRELLTVDQGLARLRAMEHGPERDAAEQGFVEMLNQIPVGGPTGAAINRPLGDIYLEGVQNFRRGMDAGRLMADVVKMQPDKNVAPPGGFSVPVGPFRAGVGHITDMLGLKQPPITADKVGAALRQSQDGQGLYRFDPAYSPSLWNLSGLMGPKTQQTPTVLPAFLGAEGGNMVVREK